MLSDLMNQILIVKRVISPEVWTLKQMYPRSYRCFFPHVSEWEKGFLGHVASCDERENCNTSVATMSNHSALFLGSDGA